MDWLVGGQGQGIIRTRDEMCCCWWWMDESSDTREKEIRPKKKLQFWQQL